MPEWKPVLQARLAGLKFSPAREAEIVDELSAHLDDRYSELVRAGTEPAEAERMALGELRDHDLFHARLRALRQAHVAEPIAPGAHRRRLVADVWQDLRYASRMLARQPGFTFAAVLTLALGIGANTAIFSLVNATLLQRLPVADSARLVYVSNGPAPGVFSYPAYTDLRDRSDVFDGFAAWGPLVASLNADATTDLVTGAIVTGRFFQTLGVEPAIGRVIGPEDDVTPGAHPVTVITHGLWQRRFGGRADIIGRSILLNGQPFSVVGVTRPGFTGAQVGNVRDLFVPMMMQPLMRPPRGGYSGDMNPDLLKVRTNQWLFAIGRLKPGVTKARAEASLGAIATAVDQAARPNSAPHPIPVFPVDDGVPGQRAQIVPVATLLLCVVGAVLLIACANVANLLLSRTAARQREIAVRLAIGANRWRLVRQFLTESLLLALAGGALGVGLAVVVAQIFRAAPPPVGALPLTLDFSIDLRVLGFSLGLSALTGILFGLVPALRASRPRLVPALKDDTAVADARPRWFRLRKILVVVEVALSLALLLAAGLFVRSLRFTQSVSPGFDVDKIISAPLNINLLRYTRDQGREFYRTVVERVQALPGVESASVARTQVLTVGRIVSLRIEGRGGSIEVFRSEGGTPGGGSRRDAVTSNVIGPGYFKTMGIGLVTGRDFAAQDAEESPLVVVVNEAFVAMQFPNENPVGRRLSSTGPDGPWREIVGVVKDSKYASLLEDRTPFVYFPLSQNHETGMTLHVRASGDPASVVRAVRREIQAIEPNLPVPTIQPMTETIGGSLYVARMGAWLLGVFAGLALLLASIGVYGVLAFSISRRTRELGIRLALGAEARDVFTLVIREGMVLVGAGVVIGLAGGFAGAGTLAQFLYGVSAFDPVTFIAVPSILALVALAACLIPARRAMNVDPTEALRYN
jgi:putative ABC transport system permease protein